MKIVATIPVRNEDWCLGLTLRALLRWVDSVVVLDHASTDGTREILAEVDAEHPGRLATLPGARDPPAKKGKGQGKGSKATVAAGGGGGGQQPQPQLQQQQPSLSDGFLAGPKRKTGEQWGAGFQMGRERRS